MPARLFIRLHRSDARRRTVIMSRLKMKRASFSTSTRSSTTPPSTSFPISATRFTTSLTSSLSSAKSLTSLTPPSFLAPTVLPTSTISTPFSSSIFAPHVRLFTVAASSGAPRDVAEKVASELLPLDEIPGPKNLFQTSRWEGLRFRADLRHVIHDRMAKEFGIIFQETLPGMKFVIITDPTEYRKVAAVDGKVPVRMELPPMAWHRIKKGWGLGLVNSNGDEWQLVRQAVAPLMLKTGEVLPHVEGMDAVARDFVDKMMRDLHPKTKRIDDLEDKMFLWSMESIALVLLNKRFGCLRDPPPTEAQEFIRNLIGFFTSMQHLLYDFPLYKRITTPTSKKFLQFADNMMDTMSSCVDEHWAEYRSRGLTDDGKEAFITKLLDAGLDSKLAVETIVDLFVGSVETTSNSIGWILYSLSVNPRVQTKAQQQVDGVLASSGGLINKSALGKLSYIKAIVREAFRLYPITYATSRILTEDVELGGYLVPEGTHCQASLYSMGRSEALFQNPLEFRPERWLHGEMDADTKAFSSLPFGHGARMCIGRRFAEQEMYIILTRILQTFKVVYEEGAAPPEGILKLVLVPKSNIPLKFELR